MQMNARYRGTCASCGESFGPGTPIEYDRKAPKRQRARHADCSAGAQVNRTADRIITIRTSGGEFYQNSRGRCEDAPCCGCCTC
jgi:hypothetical protein